MWGQVLISALKGLSWRLGTAGVRSLRTMLTGSSCLLAVPYLLFAPLPYGAAASFASNPTPFKCRTPLSVPKAALAPRPALSLLKLPSWI